ncbi:MAG: preprotein translocase subunit Sec61beta [Candidatus Bathyarchaeia archaeon]
MSKRREMRRRRGGPAPATSAGLLRFFEEESFGIKVKPKMLIILTIAFIVICVLIQFYT